MTPDPSPIHWGWGAVWGGELGLQGGEEGGLGMKKATGGKTQHGARPSPGHPEHSVRAGTGPEQERHHGHPEHSSSEMGSRLSPREAEAFQQNDLVCIPKGIISSFLHCPPSFAFQSRLTPRTRREMLLRFHIQEPVLMWKHGVQLEKSSKGGVCMGEIRAVLPQKDGTGTEEVLSRARRFS